MKRTLIAAAGLALATASGLASAASWSVIVEPGVYGRVAIGGYAEVPQVYAPQPIVAIDNGYGQVVEEAVDPAYATNQTPVYLWVPEYQRLHWAQYCREYGAYGVPVYFVDDGWYRANVLRRNWTPEQRSWSQQQWIEQDRLARDRFERQRFEHQRYEQQQRWNEQRAWQEHQQQQRQYDDQNRIRWGSAHAFVPFSQQNGPAPQQQQQQQPGGQWQQHGGQWQQHGGQWQQRGGQWQQAGNGGAQGGYPAGNAGPGSTGGYNSHPGSGQPGIGGNPAGNANNGGNGNGNGAHQGNGQPGSGGNNAGNYAGNAGSSGYGGGVGYAGGAGSQQPPSASQPHGSGRPAPIQSVGERHGDERAQERAERRGQGEARAAFEHGRGGNREH